MTDYTAWADAQVAHYERIDAAKMDAIIRNYDAALTPREMLALLQAKVPA